jgi:hypothetical protein
LILTEKTSVSIADEEGKGVEGAISGVLQPVTKDAIIIVKVSEGKTTPGRAESALIVSAWASSPKKAKTDEG